MPSPDYAFTVLVIIFISKIHNPLEHHLNALNKAVLTLRVTQSSPLQQHHFMTY